MRQREFDSFCEVVVGFAELKGRQLSPAAVKLYWNAMQHWDLEQFRAAAAELLRRSEFMPTPKDFEDLRKAGRMTPGDAFAIAQQCWRRGGRSSGNALIDRAVAALGGYDACGMTSTDRVHFLERRFAEHYEQMQDTEDVRAALPQLTSSGANAPKRIGRDS